MKIAVASSSLHAIPVIGSLLSSEHQLAGLITNPDKPTGRGQNFQEVEIASWAREHGLRVAKPSTNEELASLLDEEKLDLVITLSFGKLIPENLLSRPTFGWINIHYSLLPRWRGAAPVQWALMSGDGETGLSVFQLERGMDAGPVFLEVPVAIGDEDTTESLLERISVIAGERILEIVSSIGSGNTPTPQSKEGVTLAPKITKAMAEIDWKDQARDISLKIRALGSRPGTWSVLNGQRIVINSAVVADRAFNTSVPGRVSVESGRLYVQTGVGCIEILELTPAGKKQMATPDFLRGARLGDDARFIHSTEVLNG